MKTDWNNLDLKNDSHASLLDGITVDELITECLMNLDVKNRATVRAQFNESLNAKTAEAKAIFERNIDNIVKYINK